MATKIQKLAMLLGMAAMFMFSACGEEEVEPFAPEFPDSVVVGNWMFADGLDIHPPIYIRPDHTCLIETYSYSWAINGRHFHGFNKRVPEASDDVVTNYVDFDIRALTDTTMTVKGKRSWGDGTSSDYSGLLIRL